MAARFWVGGGSSANWNATAPTNWAASSGGAGNQSVPTSADDVTFDGNGNSNSTISATITVLSLTITSGYTATMTHNALLTIAGNWNFSGTYTIAGTSAITISAASTITAGQTWTNNLTFANSNTKTLATNLTVGGTFTSSGTTVVNKTSSETLTINGLSAIGTLSGTALIIITGGTWSGNQAVSSEKTLNGNVTLSGSIQSGGVINYSSGTITVTGSTMNFANGSTVNCNGMSFNNVALGNNATITLTSNLLINGSITGAGTNSINNTSGETVTINGGITTLTTFNTGTKIILTGGTWLSTSASAIIRNDLDIQGNVTIGLNIYYGVGTLKYISGTVDTTTNNSTLNITANCTIDTDGISWNNVLFPTGTFTINSNLTVNNNLTLSANVSIIFTGTHGFTVYNLINNSIQVATITLQNLVTYTITNSFSCFSSRVGSIILFTSNHASNRANLVMVNPSTCNVLANFTRIDASGGRTINTFNGTITNCVNVRAFNDLATVGTPI